MNFVSSSMQNRKTVILIVGPATIYGKQMLVNSRVHCLRMPRCLSAFSYNTSWYMLSNSYLQELKSPTYICRTRSTFEFIYQQTLMKIGNLSLRVELKAVVGVKIGRTYSVFEGISYFPEHYRFYGNINELRDYWFNNTQQRKYFICSFEAVCSWCCKTRGV